MQRLPLGRVRFLGLAALGLALVSVALQESVPGNGTSRAQAAAWFDHQPLRRSPLPPASAEVFLHLGIGIYLLAMVALGAYLVVLGALMLGAPASARPFAYASLAGGAVALTPIFGFLAAPGTACAGQ